MFVWSFSNWFNYLGLVDNLFGHLESETYEDALDDESFIKMLVSDINHTVRTLKIVEGEENIHLYNDDRVVDAFERACERGVKIQFVLKPTISTLE